MKNVSGGRVMVEEMVSGRPPWKKNSLWLSIDALFSGDMSALVAGFLVGEKEISMDVVVSGMSMDFADMRVNASEGFLHNAVQVEASREGLRSSGKLRAREIRSSLSALRSLSRVACAYWVANVPGAIRSLEAAKSLLGRAGVVMPELLFWMSIELGTVLVSQSA